MSCHLPWAGPIAYGQSRILMASGFSAWGITNGTAAAALLVDQLGGRSNQFSALLDPRRPGLAALGELVKHNATVARHFVAGRLRSDPAGASSGLKPGDAAVMKIGGKAAAVHRDQEGKVPAVSATCTHLGCTVEWNASEYLWDCPCHGSRFGVSGDPVRPDVVIAMSDQLAAGALDALGSSARVSGWDDSELATTSAFRAFTTPCSTRASSARASLPDSSRRWTRCRGSSQCARPR